MSGSDNKWFLRYREGLWYLSEFDWYVSYVNSGVFVRRRPRMPEYMFRSLSDAMNALHPQAVELDTSNWSDKVKAFYFDPVPPRP